MASLPSLWKFGGLSPIALAQRGYQKLNEDELSTRSSALSYYFLLALFPMFLFLVSLIGVFMGQDHQLRESILSGVGRLAPSSASSLIHSVIDQIAKSSSGIKATAGILGALWAASAGMAAVVASLNVIYKLKETRPWWKQKFTMIGLTVALSGLIILALVLVLYGGKIGHAVAAHMGLGSAFQMAWKIAQWPVALAAMFLSFAVVYHFGPDAKSKWHWVTPGAAVGVIFWLIASLGFRLYLHFFNSYSASYGSLGAAIILLLWLNLTGFAILVGAELNSVIEEEDKNQARQESRRQEVQQQLNAA